MDIMHRVDGYDVLVDGRVLHFDHEPDAAEVEAALVVPEAERVSIEAEDGEWL